MAEIAAIGMTITAATAGLGAIPTAIAEAAVLAIGIGDSIVKDIQ